MVTVVDHVTITPPTGKDHRYVTSPPPPSLSFSDTEEELNDSFSDDAREPHMDKSWLK